ncbi:hypothetical protein LC040_06345 [Bacillus tianshenii]|nr:hypothetical protein LC040_06345 [Bacillus tianshenii]
MVTSLYLVSLTILGVFLLLTLVDKVSRAFNKRKKKHSYLPPTPTATAIGRK